MTRYSYSRMILKFFREVHNHSLNDSDIGAIRDSDLCTYIFQQIPGRYKRWDRVSADIISLYRCIKYSRHAQHTLKVNEQKAHKLARKAVKAKPAVPTKKNDTRKRKSSDRIKE